MEANKNLASNPAASQFQLINPTEQIAAFRARFRWQSARCLECEIPLLDEREARAHVKEADHVVLSRHKARPVN